MPLAKLFKHLAAFKHTLLQYSQLFLTQQNLSIKEIILDHFFNPSNMARFFVRLFLQLLATGAIGTLGFAPSHPSRSLATTTSNQKFRQSRPLHSTPEPTNESEEVELTAEEEAKIGNLVANEEWSGLSMELAEIVRTAVVEDMKKNSRDFLGKEDYAVGDFTKEIDSRVKDEIAKLREKDEYELGDFSVVLDGKVKEMVCEMTGNDAYEFGDLSTEIDSRVKDSVAQFCGKDTYQVGDLSSELAKRTKEGVLKYTGQSDYKFGDLTKQAMKNYTGKDEYQFGDVTKKLMGNLFSGKKGGK